LRAVHDGVAQYAAKVRARKTTNVSESNVIAQSNPARVLPLARATPALRLAPRR
jgi:hypothetical protein